MSPDAGLPQLLVSMRPGEVPVAFGRDGQRTLADLRAHVAGLAGRISAAGSGRWLVCAQDSYAFVVALLALAQSGSTAILPPNGQPRTLRALADGAIGAILDGRAELGELAALDACDLVHGDPGTLGAIDRDAPFVEMFTSGTTAERKAIPKALRHLADEVRVLEATLGPALRRRTRVFATVPHSHLYGLLFRVLWPLHAGRAFAVETLLQPEELLPRLLECDDCALVSSPAHLRSLAGAPGLSELCGRLRAVYCSGAPLDEGTAHFLEASLGHAPVEIFGSTETGGVAWRTQGAKRGACWMPLPEVSVERAPDGRLVVSSPFVSVGERFAMGDRAELLDGGGFTLLGRVDRVMKIGENRLALPDMEAQLRGHEFVTDAALVPVELGGRTRLGAAVVLSDEGEAALYGQGRRGLSRALAAHLAPWWDRVLLPRTWRYLPELPTDARGKTSLDLVRGLFRRAAPRSPELLKEQTGPKSLQRRLRIPVDLAQLEGHFPGWPLVAGAVQVQFAMEAVEFWLGSPTALSGIAALKFRDLLRPGDEFDLRLERVAADRIDFTLVDGARVFSSGRLRLRIDVGTKGSE